MSKQYNTVLEMVKDISDDADFINEFESLVSNNKGLIAYDTVLMRPACVILASTMGAMSNYAHAFETKYWLLAPTKDLKLYPCDDEILKLLVKKTEEFHDRQL